MISIAAEPYAFELDPAACALIIIDMQRDFIEAGGFGAALGNDVARLLPAVDRTRRVLARFRELGLPVIHTREGHLPDLSDLPEAKRRRGRLHPGIGERGPMGRILVRGEPGHEIVAGVRPREGELIVDKPGKGAFYATDLDAILRAKGIQQLVVTGVTTEVCVHTTVREANDRGYDCLVLADCTASYFPEFHRVGLEMIRAQGGIFGWVSESEFVLQALGNAKEVRTRPIPME